MQKHGPVFFSAGFHFVPFPHQYIPGREKVGRWNEQSALQAMCDAEKDWHERSFRASGAFGGRQNLPFNKPEISFSFFIFQPAVHYD